MRANLHLHSRYSDGSLWPREIAERAAALGLECLSVTDHDTLGGTEELAEAAGRLGLRAIPGCEIDCHAPEIGYKSEILAYFPQGGASRTREFLDGVTRRRAERLRGFISAASTLFRKPGFTFEADRPAARIDYVWADPRLASRACAIRVVGAAPGPIRISDHLARLAEFR